MYLPKHFEEPRIDVMHELMRAHPLATLVTLTASGLDANHIPLQLAVDASKFGTLRGHVARANPLWRDFDPNVEALVVFRGPDAYISPSWYATKRETGKAVPTWNYAVVHAHGRLRVIDEASWVRAQIEALTAHNEAALPHPWAVSDAPADYTEKMIGAVVGIEIVISRLEGKWKTSQNQPAENQAGIVAALRHDARAESAAMAAMADLVAAHATPAGR